LGLVADGVRGGDEPGPLLLVSTPWRFTWVAVNYGFATLNRVRWRMVGGLAVLLPLLVLVDRAAHGTGWFYFLFFSVVFFFGTLGSPGFPRRAGTLVAGCFLGRDRACQNARIAISRSWSGTLSGDSGSQMLYSSCGSRGGRTPLPPDHCWTTPPGAVFARLLLDNCSHPNNSQKAQ